MQNNRQYSLSPRSCDNIVKLFIYLKWTFFASPNFGYEAIGLIFSAVSYMKIELKASAEGPSIPYGRFRGNETSPWGKSLPTRRYSFRTSSKEVVPPPSLCRRN